MDDHSRLLLYISEPRFRRYLAESNGNQQKALELYEWNTRLCSAFVIPIHHLEVGIRNVFHNRIADVLEDERWYRSEQAAIKVEQALTERIGDTAVAPGAVIANLTLGFWVNLTSAHHHNRYWISVLSEVFPHRQKRPSRQTINKDLSSIQHLRNRLAHHEPIYNRRLKRSWNRMQQLLGWIDPELRNWVTSQTKVDQVLQQDPRKTTNDGHCRLNRWLVEDWNWERVVRCSNCEHGVV